MFKFKYQYIVNVILTTSMLTNTYLAAACDEDDENSEPYGYMMCYMKKKSGEVISMDCRQQADSEDYEITFQRSQKQIIQKKYYEIFKEDETNYKKALSKLNLWFHENSSCIQFINRIATHSAFKEYRNLFNEFFIKCNSLTVDLLLNNDSTLFRFHKQLLGQ